MCETDTKKKHIDAVYATSDKKPFLYKKKSDYNTQFIQFPSNRQEKKI